MSAMTLAYRLYFAVAYNTTVGVNMLLALGAIAPYVVLRLATDGISPGGVALAISLTLLVTYCYTLVYVVNDYLDCDKDLMLGIPKHTARHVLGRHYLLATLGCFTAILGVSLLIWPQLAPLLIGYCALLACLSVLHSRLQTAKGLTLFAERLLKFVMPLVAVYAATGKTMLAPYIIAALIIFPWSFMAHYGYKGYFRDRLGQPDYLRFIIYIGYYSLLAICLGAGIDYLLDSDQSAVLLVNYILPAMEYIFVYTVFAWLSLWLAAHLPLRALDKSYPKSVATEKRWLVTYGLVQTSALLLGGIYDLLRN